MKTEIDLKFADGEYTFRLGLREIRELQDKTNSGIGALYARVVQGRFGATLEEGHPLRGAYRVDDLRETIRQGLIGAGRGRVDGADVIVSSLRATELVERYLDPMPLTDQWNLAASVLFAVIEGYADDVSADEADDAAPAPDQVDKKKEGGLTTPTP